jgi:hypothetical protein
MDTIPTVGHFDRMVIIEEKKTTNYEGKGKSCLPKGSWLEDD